MAGIAKQTGQSAKNLAQQIAKQMAQEPLEVLKTAKEQTTGAVEAPKTPDMQGGPQSSEQSAQVAEQQKAQDKIKAERRMEALNRELEDIRKGDIFKDLQQKIAEGTEIPLEEYPEISREQREVLVAQMEAVKQQMLNAKYANAKSEVPLPSSKPSRKMGSNRKQEAEKQQQRVEKPVPPSG